MMNTTVDWEEYNSWLRGIQHFEYKLFKSFQSTAVFVIQYKMIISKSKIISKYWRNIANYKIYICFYLLKLSACGLKGPKTTPIDFEYEIQHSHISLFVHDSSCTLWQISCK